MNQLPFEITEIIKNISGPKHVYQTISYFGLSPKNIVKFYFEFVQISINGHTLDN